MIKINKQIIFKFSHKNMPISFTGVSKSGIIKEE